MVQFNPYSHRLFTVNSLPASGKREYVSLCEVLGEYSDNYDYFHERINDEIQKNLEVYKSYSEADHSDLGSHCHVFPSFDFGNGYTAHVGMYWPEVKDYPAVSLTKDFVLEDGGDDLTLGLIAPENMEDPVPAFFTRPFFECFSDSTKFGKNLFFLDAGITGYVSSLASGETRWLFSEGVAQGYKYCRFYVFNDFTDRIKYKEDNDLTDDMMDELDNLLWNTDW